MTLQLLPTIEQLRERFVPLDTPRVLTLPDELTEALDNVTGELEMAALWLGDIEELIGSRQAIRLMRRRWRRCYRGDEFDPSLDLLRWVLDECTEQAETLTGALAVLLDPVRGSRTRYGKRTGVYAHTPYDWGKCGTPAGYQAHRRRGQDCEACRKAAARYEADRRRRSSSIGSL
jgi:hypothetical protein